jgi:hypothetical protein
MACTACGEVFALARGQRLQRLDLDGDGACRHPQGALGIEGRCRGKAASAGVHLGSGILGVRRTDRA